MTLSDVLTATTNAYNSTMTERAARSDARATQAAAQSAATQSNNTVRIAMIGGGILLLALVGFFLFRRK